MTEHRLERAVNAVKKAAPNASIAFNTIPMDSAGADARWAADTHAALLTKSPTSLKVTLRQLILGRDYDLDHALQLEYRLTQHFMAAHDFYEGVRAILVDKDHHPHWQPPTLAEVDDATVESYFAPLGAAELAFADRANDCRRKVEMSSAVQS